MKILLINYERIIRLLEQIASELQEERMSGFEKGIYDDPTTDRIESIKRLINDIRQSNAENEVLNVTVDIAQEAMAAGLQGFSTINGLPVTEYVIDRLKIDWNALDLNKDENSEDEMNPLTL